MNDPRKLFLAASAFLLAGAAAWSSRARATVPTAGSSPGDTGALADALASLASFGGVSAPAIAPADAGLSDLYSGALSVVNSAISQSAPGENPGNLSGAGLAMLTRIEDFSATPYPDAAGYSIGYGHFILPGESFTSITREQGAALLAGDVGKAVAAVRAGVKVPVTQAQFDALVIFAYNVGAGAFRSSTLLRLLNARDYESAAAQFARWTRSNKNGVTVVLSALVDRRAKEAALFTAGNYA